MAHWRNGLALVAHLFYLILAAALSLIVVVRLQETACRASSVCWRVMTCAPVFTYRRWSPSLYPDEQLSLTADGHEIGIHGWIHELHSILPAKDERDLMMRAADVLETITGKRSVGLRTPSCDFSDATLSIDKEMGLLYDSSLMADEDSYDLLLDGQPSGVVELADGVVVRRCRVLL